MVDFNDENVIVIPPDEVSAQWGKFPPGMTTAPWRADWFYVTGSEEEAKHIESFGLPAACHKKLGLEQVPILRNADLVLLNRGRELDAALAAVARQLRVVNVPDLTGCSKEEFIQLTEAHWERRSEAAQKFLDAFGEPAIADTTSPLKSVEPAEPARDEQEREEAPVIGAENFVPEPHVCIHCGLDPDGTERVSAYNGAWMHERCEPAFINARLAEEGIAQEDAASLQTPELNNSHVAAKFLEKLRPGGPWVLTAIVPDGKTTTATVYTADQVEAFVRKHNGKRNLYYSVNPTRAPLNKKAAKTDIIAIEFILTDCDPRDDETPEQAKARYRKAIEQFTEETGIKFAFGIDSGNGIQGAIRLEKRIELKPPVRDEKGELRFSEEDQAKIDDAEPRAATLMRRLGAKPGTQNIDRILRLPDTTNLPNAKKRKAGRTECQAKLLWFDDVSYPLDAFPKEEPNKKNGDNNDKEWTRDESGSGYGYRFMRDCHGKGMSYDEARTAILADKNEAGEWANRVDERQLERAWEHSKPKPTLIVELGTKLWGAPTQSGKEFRFGADQSKVIDPVKGNWFDFATNKGGSIRELMKKVEFVCREQTNTDDIVAVRAVDIAVRSLDWIWPGHLLRGAQELLSGLPDLCKSQVQIYYIACATARLPWPDGSPAIEPINVIMLTAEDTLDQIVVPRLIAAGADTNRVHIVKCIKADEHNRQFLLNEDLYRLEYLVKKIGNVGLVTLDPITAYMGGKLDSHRATDVRAQLGPLKDFAERHNTAVSTITHPPKKTGQRAIDHFIASQAFIAACRVGHLSIPEMEEGEEPRPTGRILFTTVRHSASAPMPTLAYRKETVFVDNAGNVPRVMWEGESNITADAAVAAAAGKKSSDQQLKVQAFLHEILKDGKPVLQKEIEAAAKAEGFTEKQLRTARERLGIHTNKEEGKMGGGWFWQLPDPSEGRYHY
jgi:hypothetical protein